MTTATSARWFCIGIPPRIPPCGADGESDRDAEAHTKATTHSTTSGTAKGAEAIHRATTTGDDAA